MMIEEKDLPRFRKKSFVRERRCKNCRLFKPWTREQAKKILVREGITDSVLQERLLTPPPLEEGELNAWYWPVSRWKLTEDELKACWYDTCLVNPGTFKTGWDLVKRTSCPAHRFFTEPLEGVTLIAEKKTK